MNSDSNDEKQFRQRISAEDALVLEPFPKELRKLVEDEIKDGNAIQSIEYGFPAAPCGASVKLVRPVKSERRVSTIEVDFCARNNSQYSGEFTTSQRHFFVLEPPVPSEPIPDMDTIREEMAARQRKADADRFQMEIQQTLDRTIRSEVIDKFQESLKIDYEHWREGVGYDINLLQTASIEERSEIERILLYRRVEDWRDVEALAALDSPKAFEKLRNARKHTDHAVVMAILEHAPQLVSLEERTELLVAALQSADFYHGLSQALHQVERFHPPVIIETLLNCLLDRESGILVQFAGMLMYLHGKADVPFDWEQRPFFLRFNTSDRVQRETAFRQLCEAIGIDSDKYLNARK
jgi:hypothetical protein